MAVLIERGVSAKADPKLVRLQKPYKGSDAGADRVCLGALSVFGS